MAQQVLLYTRTLPTRLAVEGALESALVQPVRVTSPAELLEKSQQGSWDAIILDGDGSPVPLSKLLPVVGARAALTGTVVLALTGSQDLGQAQAPVPMGEVFLFNRPVGTLSLLGALNRMLMARSKKPLIRAAKPVDGNKRRTLRVPLLMPVAYRAPARHTAWSEGEVLDISIGGAGVAALPGIQPGETIEVKNLLNNEQAAFRVVWMASDLDEIAAGVQTAREDLHFWRIG